MKMAANNHKKKRRRNDRPAGGGGAFLAVCSGLAGLIAMIKRIPLTNMIGDNGNAYYSMAFDTYTFFFYSAAMPLPPLWLK